MAAKRLRIGTGFRLPPGAATKTFAVLAQRRKGKTYTANVTAEEMVTAGQPWVALDPTGAWWGLRSSADGKKAGLPVLVIGGEHGQLPLKREAGALIADLVIDKPGYYVIDLSGLDSRAAEREFATAFAERFYRRKNTVRTPIHLFIDEAEVFVPQSMMGDNARMVGAFEAIVKRGGIRGIGTTLISQRAASVNKNVLEQIDCLIVLRVVGPNDRKAILGYVEAAGGPEQRKALMDSLASLDLGEAWVWEPGAEPPLFERVRIRERKTFNSSATPDQDEPVEPTALFEYDIDELTEQIAATVEQAKAEDPKALRKRIADLEHERRERDRAADEVLVRYGEEGEGLIQVVERLASTPTEIPIEVEVEVGVVPGPVQKDVRDIVSGLRDQGQTMLKAAEELAVTLGDWPERVVLNGVDGHPPSDAPHKVRGEGHGSTRGGHPERSAGGGVAAPPSPSRGRAPAENPATASSDVEVDEEFEPKGLQVEILRTLASFDRPLERIQLGHLVGKRASGGYFRNQLSPLKTAGLIVEDGGVALTEAGLAAAGGPQPRFTRDEVLDRWRSNLKGLSRELFDHLVEAHPGGYTREELGQMTGKEHAGGYFRNNLSPLKTAKLVTERGGVITASDDLFLT